MKQDDTAVQLGELSQKTWQQSWVFWGETGSGQNKIHDSQWVKGSNTGMMRSDMKSSSCDNSEKTTGQKWSTEAAF